MTEQTHGPVLEIDKLQLVFPVYGGASKSTESGVTVGQRR